jgi:hypothetical protein
MVMGNAKPAAKTKGEGRLAAATLALNRKTGLGQCLPVVADVDGLS